MKKPIENIFSKKKTTSNEIKCPNPKIPIIIDTREKQSLISANLINKNANIKYETLQIGDYLIEDTIIERKTFQDFVGSMMNKRLLAQIQEIKKYPKHFLIIEGFCYDYNSHNVHENATRGMLLSIATDFQVPIIYTQDEEDTANFLILLARKYEKRIKGVHSRGEYSPGLRPSKTLKTSEEQKQFILEGFPEIGPTAAKKLLENFPTLQQSFNATEEQLKQAGLSEIQIKKFLQLLKN